MQKKALMGNLRICKACGSFQVKQMDVLCSYYLLQCRLPDNYMLQLSYVHTHIVAVSSNNNATKENKYARCEKLPAYCMRKHQTEVVHRFIS